ncbi:hypothetical protein [Nostoc sp.]|uniref:hypothetical protein n=1 Tax=Nostoc sp. TaxID=1180 RepID=UPI003FA53150
MDVASSLKSFNKKHQKYPNIETEPKEHFNEEIKSATETSKSKEKDKKQNSDEHLTSTAKSKISDNQAKEESSQSLDPKVTRLLNKPTQSNLAGSGGRAQKTPKDGLGPQKLAQLNVAGGNIRNIALNAAKLAADAGEVVSMKHLLQATKSEYVKLERPLTDTEVRGWV